MESHSPSSPLTIPMAIVVAGVLIAGAIFLSRGNSAPRAEGTEVPTVEAPANEMAIRPLSETDHVRGDPNATILIVEYSDTECPFCKGFHNTMQQIIEAYGKTSKVAWAYRHFPLVQIHPKAPIEAQAQECAAELGGNSKFWEYTDEIFRVTPSNNGLDLAELPKIAGRIGLDEAAFKACLDSGEKLARVQEDYTEGVAAGGTGTPFNILVLKRTLTASEEKRLADLNADLMRRMPANSPDAIAISADKQKVAIGGAFQYPLMKEIIDLLLK